MIAFILWLAMVALMVAAIYWFNVPGVAKITTNAVAATVRLHLKFIAACWLLLTTRR